MPYCFTILIISTLYFSHSLVKAGSKIKMQLASKQRTSSDGDTHRAGRRCLNPSKWAFGCSCVDEEWVVVMQVGFRNRGLLVLKLSHWFRVQGWTWHTAHPAMSHEHKNTRKGAQGRTGRSRSCRSSGMGRPHPWPGCPGGHGVCHVRWDGAGGAAGSSSGHYPLQHRPRLPGAGAWDVHDERLEVGLAAHHS